MSVKKSCASGEGEKEMDKKTSDTQASRNSRDYLPKVLLIRPHHFLDIVRELGLGTRFKPAPSGHANHIVAQWIEEDHDIILELIIGIDAICKPCSKIVDGYCTDIIKWPSGVEISKQEFNDTLDAQLFEKLRIKQGVRMSARDFCRLSLERLGSDFLLYPELESGEPEKHARNMTEGLTKYIEG